MADVTAGLLSTHATASWPTLLPWRSAIGRRRSAKARLRLNCGSWKNQIFLVVVLAALPPVRRPEKASGRAVPFLTYPYEPTNGEVWKGLRPLHTSRSKP